MERCFQLGWGRRFLFKTVVNPIFVKNKHLILFFLASLALGLSLRKCDLGCGKPFKATLFDCDTTQLTEFSYKASLADSADITWTRAADRWFCTKNGQTISPSEEFCTRFMAALANARVRQIAARLPVKPGGEKTYFGKNTETAQFSFSQNGATFGPFFVFERKDPNGASATLARLPTGEEAFELENNDLLFLLKTPFLALKNRQLFRLKPNDVIALAFNFPNKQPVMLDRVEGFWQTPGGTKPASETRLVELFRVLKKVENSLPFAENFGEMDKSKAFTTRLMVSTTSTEGSFSLVGFQRTDRRGFVVNSSQNPDNYFEVPDSLAMLIFSDPTIQ